MAYLRVSTEDQHLGPEAQRSSIESWAARKGVSVASWHVDDGVSGGAPLDKRPGLLEALDSAKNLGAGLLVVAKRDRLARDVMVAAMVERLAEREGTRIVSADGMSDAEGPEGQLMRGIVDLFAQYERALIRSRTKAALAVKKSRKERVGQIPYGQRLGSAGLLEVDPGEQLVIKRIFELRASGTSVRRIAQILTEEKLPSRGRRWHLTSISRILHQ